MKQNNLKFINKNIDLTYDLMQFLLDNPRKDNKLQPNSIVFFDKKDELFNRYNFQLLKKAFRYSKKVLTVLVDEEKNFIFKVATKNSIPSLPFVS